MNELFSLLERQVRFIREQPDHRLFLALPSLVDFVQREPRLRAIVDQLTLEFESAIAKYRATDKTHVAEVFALLEANADWVSADRFKAPKEQLTKYVQQSGKCQDDPLVYRKRDSDAASSAITYLTSVFDNLETEGIPENSATRYQDSAHRLAAIGIEHQQAFFEYCYTMTSSAGACWKILKDLAGGISPTGPVIDKRGHFSVESYLKAEACKRRMKDTYILLGLDQSQGAKQTCAKHRSTADSALSMFLEDMALRIGIHLSHQALVKRFKAKCELFLAESLCAQVAMFPRRAEILLTESAAQFLFDQGLNPLFNAQIVRLRPDLFDPNLPHALYIEAKQYGEADPKGMIEKATWQVWDTWNELDSSHQVREAFLLVFRISGPLVTFDKSAHLEGRTLYPILVDIAPPAKKGSRAKQKPIHISAQELLPRKGRSA